MLRLSANCVVHLRGGAAERAAVGQCQQVFQLFEVHGV
jgi:hypothetical protein